MQYFCILQYAESYYLAMKYILFSALIGSHLISAAPLTLLTAKERYDAYRAQAYLNQKAVLESRESGCNLNSVIVRKEWHVMLCLGLAPYMLKHFIGAHSPWENVRNILIRLCA
jgi:hypothetical protein